MWPPSPLKFGEKLRLIVKQHIADTVMLSPSGNIRVHSQGNGSFWTKQKHTL